MIRCTTHDKEMPCDLCFSESLSKAIANMNKTKLILGGDTTDKLIAQCVVCGNPIHKTEHSLPICEVHSNSWQAAPIDWETKTQLLESQLTDLREKVDRMRPYVQHLETCATITHLEVKPCDCGLDKLDIHPASNPIAERALRFVINHGKYMIEDSYGMEAKNEICAILSEIEPSKGEG